MVTRQLTAKNNNDNGCRRRSRSSSSRRRRDHAATFCFAVVVLVPLLLSLFSSSSPTTTGIGGSGSGGSSGGGFFFFASALPPGFRDEGVADKSGTTSFCFIPHADDDDNNNNNDDDDDDEASSSSYILLLGRKKGTIYAIMDPDTHGRTNKDSATIEVLNIMDKTCSDGERGVSSIIIHPEYRTNRYVYIFYTWDKHGGCQYSATNGPVNVVARYTVSYDTKKKNNNNNGVPQFGQETIIFETSPLPSKVHNGGDMIFGNDGYLYVTLGNGGMAYEYGNSQLSNIMLGSLIRITEDGKVPSDNPFVVSSNHKDVPCNDGIVRQGQTSNNEHCGEIYSIGLRNPWRFAMNPNTPHDVTQLYINDVGGSTWEEINEMTIPVDPSSSSSSNNNNNNNKDDQHRDVVVNFGYRDREGPCKRGSTTDCEPPKGMTDPIHWYQHNDDGDGCITGGTFIPVQNNHRETQLKNTWPKRYTKNDDTYMFADYVYRTIYILQKDGTNYCRNPNDEDDDCGTNNEGGPPRSGYTMKEFHTTGDLGAPLQLSFGPYKNTLALYYVTWQGDDEYSIRRIVYAGGDDNNNNNDDGEDEDENDKEDVRLPVKNDKDEKDEEKDEKSPPVKSPTNKPSRSPTPEPTNEPTPEPTKDPTPVPTPEPTKDPTTVPEEEPLIPNPRPVVASPTFRPFGMGSPTTMQPSKNPTKNPTPEEPTSTADEDDPDEVERPGGNSEHQQQQQHRPPLFVYEENNRPTTLQLCQGDCDSDADCAESLICYKVVTSSEGTAIPGCDGTSPTRTDFCILDPNTTTESPVKEEEEEELVIDVDVTLSKSESDNYNNEDDDKYEDYYYNYDNEMSNNMAPDAEIFTEKFVYDINELITFDASNSSDPDHFRNDNNDAVLLPSDVVSTSKLSLIGNTPDEKLHYEWDFGEGTTSTKPIQKVRYSSPGKYRVRLTVTDSVGFFDKTSMEIMVGRPPIPDILSPVNGTTFAVGDIFTLSGAGTDADGKALDPTKDLSWEVRQRHSTHYHPFLDPDTIGNGIVISPAPEPEDFHASTNSYLQILLTATDPSTGLTSTVTRDIYPQTKLLRFQTDPPGLLLNLDAFDIRTPSNAAESLEVISWMKHSVSLYVEDQGDMIFDTWNNGISSRKSKYLVQDDDDDDVLIAKFQSREAMTTNFFTNQNPHPSPPPNNDAPSLKPNRSPILPVSVALTTAPTRNPTVDPTAPPTFAPTTPAPSLKPTNKPTEIPSYQPTAAPVMSLYTMLVSLATVEENRKKHQADNTNDDATRRNLRQSPLLSKE